MAHRYRHKENVGFTDRDILNEVNFDCPPVNSVDNRLQAFVYAFLLASGAFDTWKCNENGDYVLKDHDPKHLSTMTTKITEGGTMGTFRLMRDCLRHPETPFTEIQAFKHILQLLGTGTGSVHRDPDVLAYE